MHFVYIVRCADGSLYTGYARDPHARAKVHNAGRGAKYTASRRPVTVVFTQRFRTRSAALRREYALKHWSHAAKAALVSTHTADAKFHDRTVSAAGMSQSQIRKS